MGRITLGWLCYLFPLWHSGGGARSMGIAMSLTTDFGVLGRGGDE